jgi:hypothetical protein
MKQIDRFRLTCALAGFSLVALLPAVADAAVFAGTWSVSASLGSPVVETTAPTCVFRQDGIAITGTCTGPSAVGLAAGRVVGRTVIWSWHKHPTNNLQINSIATYRGVFTAGGQISGTWSDSAYPGAVGTFAGHALR